MATYFELHKPKLHQWQAVRDPKGTARFSEATGTIVVHTYECPPDRGVKWAADLLVNRTDRQASYHCLAGAASETDALQLVPWSGAAWHETNTNRWSIGISMVTYSHLWGTLTATQRRNLVHSAAYAASLAAKWLKRYRGITVPAKLITRAEALDGRPGFVAHGTMDPGRRSDPGAAFPWSAFLAHYAKCMADTSAPAKPTPDPKDDDMAVTSSDLAKIARAVWSHEFQGYTFDGVKVDPQSAGLTLKATRKEMLRQSRRAAETLVLVRGYEAALEALAKAQGQDGAAVVAAVKEAATDALRDLKVVLVAEDNPDTGEEEA